MDETRIKHRWGKDFEQGGTEKDDLTANHAKLASQARHEMDAQTGCSLARSVVANLFPK